MAVPLICVGEPTQTADELMQLVRSNLPAVALDLEGQLTTRNRQGQVRNVQEIDIQLRLDEHPPRAAYTLRSRFGEFREQVEVSWDVETGAANIQHRLNEGEPLLALDDPDVNIDETEISWSDISLSVLWWTEGTITGKDKKLGRLCTLVDLPAPDPHGLYEGARLWVDPEIGAVLEMELHQRDEGRSKRLRVKSLRKVHDRWFLREMEVLNVNTFRRTSLVLKIPEEG